MRVPKSFLMLVESEMTRARGDGLTTALRKVAKHLNYKFVVHNRSCQYKGDLLINNDIRGTKGGYIFDHYAVYFACVEMINAFNRQQTKITELEQKLVSYAELERANCQRTSAKSCESCDAREILDNAKKEIEQI